MMMATLMTHNNPISNVASNAKNSVAMKDGESEELCDENHNGKIEKENS